MEIPYLILGALLVWLVVAQVNQRRGSPLLAIAERWLRWIVFAFGSAQACVRFELIDRPFWVLVVVFFLVWFLGETLLNWLSIHALSVSPLPLFPRYVPNLAGDEWPTQPRALQLRDELRGLGYKQMRAVKAEVGGGIYLRVSVYQDATGHERVQVTFIPQASGTVTICLSVTSVTENGSRYVTDNLYVPFAGFYPENWYVERFPLCRSLRKLLERHRARLAATKEKIVTMEIDPVADMNSTQQELDRLNTELGFLHSHQDREDLGKITHEGRYRVWKEVWMLNYLGRSARYE